MRTTLNSGSSSDDEGESDSIGGVRRVDNGDAVRKIVQPSGSRKQSFPVGPRDTRRNSTQSSSSMPDL